MKIRLPLIVAAIVLALGGGAVVWRLAPHASTPAASDVGGPFTLIDQSGATTTDARLHGKWSAVFFGYTYCPDVCPTTLANLGAGVTALGDDAKQFQVVFITIDPERDTAPVLARYLSSATFPRGVIGLTGAPAQIAKVAKAYHVYYQKVPQGASYSMDHTAVVYLMAPDGRFVRPLDVNVPPAEIARQVREAMSGA